MGYGCTPRKLLYDKNLLIIPKKQNPPQTGWVCIGF